MIMPTVAERRTRRAGGARRETALEVAVAVLARRGYERTRFSDVAEASGVAVSTLQSYFGSRDDMLIEALRRCTQREVAALEAEGAAAGSPWERLVALVDRGLQTPIPVWRMLLEFWHAAAHDEELREHSVVLQARYRRPFAGAIRDGVRQAAFQPSRDVDDIVDAPAAAYKACLDTAP